MQLEDVGALGASSEAKIKVTPNFGEVEVGTQVMVSVPLGRGGAPGATVKALDGDLGRFAYRSINNQPLYDPHEGTRWGWP